MRKQEFLRSLKRKLPKMPKQELNERLNFYSEMIDDLVEEGLTEHQATSRIGSVNEIASQVAGETACQRKEKKKEKRINTGELVLIIIGSPVWLPLFLAVCMIVLAFYIVAWSLVAVAWTVELPFFIFSFVSKCLLVFCKKATKCTVKFTKLVHKYFWGLFVRRQ